MANTEQQPLDVAAVIGAQTYATKLRYSQYVEQEDLEQEAWVWVLEHPSKMKEHEENESPSQAAYALGRDLWGVMDRYARKEKAARSGYQPDDEQFASDAVINVMLPYVLKKDASPPVRDGERTSNTSDPAEGGGWIATYLDVKQAWLKSDLTGQQRDLLIAYYYDEYTQLEIADQLGVTQQAVAKRLKQARGKLIEFLGGYKPREYEPQYRDRPGAQHNSDAIIAALR